MTGRPQFSSEAAGSGHANYKGDRASPVDNWAAREEVRILEKKVTFSIWYDVSIVAFDPTQ